MDIFSETILDTVSSIHLWLTVFTQLLDDLVLALTELLRLL